MGKIQIMKIPGDNTIGVLKDFRNMSRGEIAQFITELELAKKQLLEKWLDAKEV